MILRELYVLKDRRQERRIAMLIDAILTNRAIGLNALAQYRRDRAIFANRALMTLRQIFLGRKESGLEFGPSENPDELLIARLVPSFYTYTFSLNRGPMLLILAKELGKWPRINEAIRRATDRSRSVMVDQFRGAIEEELRHSCPRTHVAKLLTKIRYLPSSVMPLHITYSIT